MNTNTNTWMKVLSDTNMRLIIHTNTNTNTDTDACLKILTDTLVFAKLSQSPSSSSAGWLS